MGRSSKKKTPRNPYQREQIAESPTERITLDASPSDSRAITVQGEISIGSAYLDTEIVRADGGTILDARRVSSEQIRQAQSIITQAIEKDTAFQMNAIDEAIASLYPYKPKPGQREALHQLIYSRKDLILIAGTGFGKSMILQAVSLLIRRSITLVILPLNQIGNEQCEFIQQIGGMPCFLNRETIGPKLLNEVKQGHFTHVLISPELAIGDDFRPIASSPSFKQQVSLVVVDEAHLVYHWGRAFRTAYSRLNLLRSWLGSQIPWFACSATLDSQTLASLKKGITFEPDVKVQRMSIDRPELLFRIGWIPKGAGFKALQFLFTADEKNVESVYETLSQIPKTIIFFESRKDAHKAADECQDWLLDIKHQHYTNDQLERALSVFHRNTSSTDKKTIMAEFMKEGVQSQIRIIFATEALGMGADFKDVRRTVQWGLPTGEHPATQLQRGGRASRDKLDGEMIMLLPEWTSGERSTRPKSKKNERNQNSSVFDTSNDGLDAGVDQTTKKLTDEQRRGNLSDFYYNLSNSECKNPPICIRRQFLDFFNEPGEYRSGRRPGRCCSNCNPQYRLGKLAGFYQYHELGPRGNQRTKSVSEALNKWADEQACLLYKPCAFPPESTLFLSQDLRDKLTKNAHSVLDLESLQKLLGSWRFSKSHGQALFKIIWDSYRPGNATTSNRQAAQTPGPNSQPPSIISSFNLSTPADFSRISQSGRSSAKEACEAASSPLSIPSKRIALESISSNIRVKKTRAFETSRNHV